MTQPSLLVLADGSSFEGVAFGADQPGYGELVFNTSMSGYQEILSDPSYAGQIVTFTMPHIGNYGTNRRDQESDGIKASALVVRDVTEPSSWRSEQSLNEWLKGSGVPGITGIDTRALTRRLRDHGVIAAAVAPGKTAADTESVLADLRAQPAYGDVDWVKQVAAAEVTQVTLNADDLVVPCDATDDARAHVVVLDYGVKHSILRHLMARDLRVTLAPNTSSAADVLALKPDGVMVSNGPGDPALLAGEADKLRVISSSIPTWGICLGHQLLAQAFGAKTFKMKFGHRGPNQPVLARSSGRVLITSQNHGYAVDASSMPDELEVTQHNLNDDTVEAFRHRDREIVAVQYHPEAGPGPHDAAGFFDEFRDVLRSPHRTSS